MFDVQCWMFDVPIFTIATNRASTYSKFMRPIARMLFVFSLLFATSLLADDWPQWLGPNRDSVWRESGIAEKFPTNGPPILWRAAIGGGYAGPAIANGRVYVSDRQLAQGASNPSDPFAQ